MNTYAGDFADLYDLFHDGKPYETEATVIDRVFREYGSGPHNRLLEVACGTGRHALAFAGLGWSVVGVDQSSEMLARARDRASGFPVAFMAQDMRSLDVPGAAFDAATCLFDSIGYAVSNEGVIAALGSIRRHLRPGGLLAVEFWHAPPMLARHDPVRYREWDDHGDVVVRVSQTALDVVRQTAQVSYTVHRLSPTGAYRRWRESHENRFFGIQEMALFLDAAGFAAMRWLAGYELDDAIDETTWHIVVVAEALEGPLR